MATPEEMRTWTEMEQRVLRQHRSGLRIDQGLLGEVVPVASPMGGGGGGDTRFLAKITGYATLASNRWKYGWVEVTLDGNDDVLVTGGRSGAVGDGYAINLIEINNDGSGIEGNGVNVSALPGSFALQPAPVDVVVAMWFVGAKPVFQYENAVDGEC